MILSSSAIIIIVIVVIIILYLLYNQIYQKSATISYKIVDSNVPKIHHDYPTNFENVNHVNIEKFQNDPNQQKNQSITHQHENPPMASIIIDNKKVEPYSDAIKRQDLYSMYDPLTYPQLRLPREVLEKYNEYYEKNGVYPPFGQATQKMFDNPVINGILIKMVDNTDPFDENIPSAVPLFRVKSSKNTNRYFYYIIDQRYLSKIELKIPLDHVKINGTKINNADFYGLPELFDGDIIEHIPIYPGAKFKVTLYKTFHFP